MNITTGPQWRRVKALLLCAAGLHLAAHFLPLVGDSSGMWPSTSKASWRYWFQLLNDFYFAKSRSMGREDLIMLLAWLANPLFWIAMAAFLLKKWLRLSVIGGIALLPAIAVLAVAVVAYQLHVRLPFAARPGFLRLPRLTSFASVNSIYVWLAGIFLLGGTGLYVLYLSQTGRFRRKTEMSCQSQTVTR
ncbi:MAG TPA: hypothetical protein VKI17_04845 [Gemmataceae bacterium]|nr:hypothetical protein [Gemmataceae bacterium]